MTTLLRPSLELLPGYVAALRRGWSPDALHPAAAAEELAAIESDPAGFVAGQEDLDALGAPIVLPDGTLTAPLPGFWRWIWEQGEFCGAIGLRWQPGTSALPAHVLGHVGYGIVAWRRGQGCATRALARMLEHAWSLGLEHVEVVTDPDNVASQRVVEACGGGLVERFRTHPAYGGAEKLRLRIPRPQPRRPPAEETSKEARPGALPPCPSGDPAKGSPWMASLK